MAVADSLEPINHGELDTDSCGELHETRQFHTNISRSILNICKKDG
jgi:hypothetical protein